MHLPELQIHHRVTHVLLITRLFERTSSQIGVATARVESFGHTGELSKLQLEIWALCFSVVGALLYLVGGSRFCAPFRKRCKNTGDTDNNGRTES